MIGVIGLALLRCILLLGFALFVPCRRRRVRGREDGIAESVTRARRDESGRNAGDR